MKLLCHEPSTLLREVRVTGNSDPPSLSTSSETANGTMAAPKKKQVSFSAIHVREYDPMWDNSPSLCGSSSSSSSTCGPSICFSWKYQPTQSIDLDAYEGTKQHTVQRQRRGHQLYVTTADRLERLVQLGYSRSKLEREMRRGVQDDDAESPPPPRRRPLWKSFFPLSRHERQLERRQQPKPPRRATSGSSSSSNSCNGALRIALSQY